MKKIHLIIFILFVSKTIVFPQKYELVDSIVKNYPSKFYNLNDLTSYINNDFESQEEKARAIYTWIALNIKYDLHKLISLPTTSEFLNMSDEELLEEEKLYKDGFGTYTLRTGKGICLAFSILYRDLCKLESLECEIIDGAGKNGILNVDSMTNGVNHCWNAVKIGNEWKLIDVTWAAGYYDNDSAMMIQKFNDFYFFTPPTLFANSHFPVDSKWLFTKKSKRDFDKSPIYFSSFYEKNFSIETPKNGTISIGRKNKIQLIFSHCNNECLSFKFGNECERRIVCPEIINEKCIYELEYKYIADTYLTIYSNNERIVRYLVKK